MLKTFNKVLSIVLAVILALPVQGFAQTITLPDGTTVISFDKSSANDTPVVNIAAPNTKGLSHNRFQTYNVGPENLILNNSKETKTGTLIGGEILGNPNLIRAGREAQIILNEITSANPSVINGYTEIAGSPAELIIANPNGISIAGAGFINTPSVSLITGNSKIQNGSLLGFDISQTGKLEITGALSVENADLSLIGRYISASGAIHANNIDIFAGNKYFDYNTREISSENTGDAKEFAVDVSALGGMYANRIRIIGTEEGFGVRTIGNLVADLSDIEINNNGKIEAKDLQAKQSVNLTSAEETEITNTIGENINIEAGKDIKAEELHSLKDINLKSNQDIIATKTYAEQDINIEVGRDIKDGELYAKNNINLKAANANDNTLKANNDINIELSQTLNNTKSLEAQKDINIKAETINNEGLILSNNDIAIEAKTTNNTNKGEISAYNNILLKQTQTLNNSGLLLANNKLNIEGGILNNNESASIYGKNNLNIKTDGEINNYLANIYSDGDINIAGQTKARSGDVTNTGGLIQAGNDITIKADNINNLSIDNCDPTKEVCYTLTKTHTGQTADSGQQVVYEVVKAQSNLAALNYGRILANNDITFSAENVLNRSSIIFAGNIFNGLIDNKFVNQNTNFTIQVKDTMQKSNTFWYFNHDWIDVDSFEPRFIWDICFSPYVHDSDGGDIYEYSGGDCYGGGAFYGSGNFRCSKNYLSNPRDEIIQSQTPAIVSAKAVNINTSVLGNGISDTEDVNINWGTVPKGNSSNPISDNNFTFNGLFKEAAPDSTYLYASTNRFIDPHDYTGVNYLLVKLTEAVANIPQIIPEEPAPVFNPVTDIPSITIDKQHVKFLGDAYYEQKLIEEEILRLTGSRYLYEGPNAPLSMNEQMARLYDNTLEAFADLSLNFGKALTAEQILQLKDNIIWYVEQEINGQKVYVPTLYVAEHNKEQFLNNLNNSTIRGEEINITADDIINSGNIEAGVAHLYASGDIKNISGVIHAGDTLEIRAEGDIINETKKNTIQHGGNNYQHEYLSDVGSISSDGDLNMTAGQDINIKAAEVLAGNNLNIQAENVNVGTLELNQDVRIYGNNYKYENSSTTNVGSLIGAGNDININANNNITIKASDILAQNDIHLEAENINIFSAVDESHYYSYQESKDIFGGSVDEVRKDKTWHVGSDIMAGGNLNLQSHNDINVLASSLSTQNGDILLDAGENINIFSGINTEASLDRHEKTSWFGFVGSGDIIYDNIRALEAASAFSGNNITLKSGADTTIFASDVGAQNNGDIQTGGNFNLLAGIESNYHEEQHWEKSFSDVVAGFDGGRLYAGIEYKITEDTLAQYDEQARASTLNFGENLNVDAGDTINIKGSDIAAQSVVLAAEEINITTQEERHESKAAHTEGTVEITVGVGNAYADAALTVVGVAEATKAVDAARKKLNEIQDLYDKGLATKGALNDAKLNLTAASAVLAQAVIDMGTSGEKVAASGGLYGFYADVAVKGEYTEQAVNAEGISNRGSSILTDGNLVLNSAKDLNQHGSDLYSDVGDIIYNVSGDLNITAAQDTVNINDITRNYTAGFSIGTYGGAPASGSIGVSKSNGSYSSITNINSTASAEQGAIIYNVGGDMSARGYNAIAEDMALNVGGSFLLESLQDSVDSYGSSSSFGAGVGTAGGSASIGLGNNNEETNFTNSVSYMVASNSITADIIGNTYLKGSVIANISEDGTDGGNMIFNTGSFTYEDIKDKSISEGGGFGLSTSTWNPAQPTKINAKGRTKISIQDNGHILEGYTKATLGQGQINIGGPDVDDNNLLAGVNRDISDVQKITRDQMTGALDLEIIIDHRWFSQEGRDEMNPIKGYKKRQEAVDKMFGEAIDDTELTMGINNDDKKYMGRMTEDPITGEVLVDTSGMPWYEKMTYDDNPIFGFIYNYFPGAKAATLYHDYEYDADQNNRQPHSGVDLALSIPGSFYGTWYSTIFGKPFSTGGGK